MHLTIVYASNLFSDRELLWHELANLASAVDKAWLLMGDLNNIFNPKDNKGALLVPFSYLRGFSNCLLTCGLTEASIQGLLFTWRRKGIDTHIGKVLINHHNPIITFKIL